MLIALSENQMIVRADEACLSEHYRCPGCKKKVILKKGQVNVHHFAHIKKEGCASFSEGETEEHLKGKLDLYNWLKHLQIPVQLEPYLNDLQQRPDLLAIINEVPTAIEFQCSPIPIETVKKRTEGYLSSGYRVLWIVGQKVTLKGEMTATQKTYVGEHNHTYYFMHYNLTLKKLVLYSHIKSSDRGICYHKRSFATYSSLPSEGLVPLKRYAKALKTSNNLETKMKHLARMSYQKRSHTREFFSLMYSHGDSLQSIPFIVLDTMEDEWMIRTFSYQWKYAFLIWVEQQATNRVLTSKMIKRVIDEWSQNKAIVFHTLPNITDTALYRPIFQWINHLENAHILVKIGKEKWKFSKKAKRWKGAL